MKHTAIVADTEKNGEQNINSYSYLQNVSVQ